ncbi:MAG: aminodeoxychorismate/anthranilate synthase component II, partial [Acidimicrobiales bacterium]
WNLVQYIEEIGVRTRTIRNDRIDVDSALSSGADGIILSPGPCTPNEAGICVELIRRAPSRLPILGVCLGHQCIGQAMGASIGAAKEIRHGKTSSINNSGGALFEGLPADFDVVRYHSLAVNRSTMPRNLVANAWAADGEIMAIEHVSRPVFGVQFHPESIKTEHGHALLRNFLQVVGRSQ